MAFRDATASVAKGLIAGAAGTAAMTAFQMVEMKLTDRSPSTAPADAVETVLDVEPKSEQAEQRLSNLTHWSYGTGWGAVRGLMGAAGVGNTGATGALFALVWGSGLTMLPALGVAPKPTEWGPKALAMDAAMHAVYAGTVSAVYEALDS